MRKTLSRRAVALGSTAFALGAAALPGRARAAEFRYRQFHNQPVDSSLHRALAGLWDAVRTDTNGRLEVEVVPQNGGIPGGDPQALRMLVAGEVEFFTLMGGLLSEVVPVADIQGIPFAFSTQEQVFKAVDGKLGAHIAREAALKGITMVPGACFENGFRQISTLHRPIRAVDDLAGLKIRTPAGELFVEFFTALGAKPATVNLNRLYDALRGGQVEAQENPLNVIEANRLYEVQNRVSITNHMWSGFNHLANLEKWRALPGDLQAVAARHAVNSARLQRKDAARLNLVLAGELAKRGMVFNTTDTSGFRPKLGAFYARWRKKLGETAWALLEAETGRLG